ncbi:MAG: NYN domain-containing protein [Phycisphaerae bacterium]
MALIIDTYNCVHAGTALGGAFADMTVRKLCQWIVQAPHRSKTTLVIDGRPKPEEPSENEFPDLHLVYSGAGIEADTVIVQMVERSQNRRNLTVVTNDRALAAAIRRLNAVPQSCEHYLQALLTAHNAGRKLGPGGQTRLPTQKTQGKIDPSVSAHWLKEFGITPPPEEKPKNRGGDDPDDLDMKDLMGF